MKTEPNPPDLHIHCCIWEKVSQAVAPLFPTSKPVIHSNLGEPKRLISKCPSLPPTVRRQGAESSLLICFRAAMGRKWPARNGFHHIRVWLCYDVWRAAIHCDSSCQSLLLPRHVLLNLTWWAEHAATGLVTPVWHGVHAVLLKESTLFIQLWKRFKFLSLYLIHIVNNIILSLNFCTLPL